MSALQDPSYTASFAHSLPWEVIGAVCEQADEATLVQLCLVSFGMLELAGPVLYRHVNINLIEEIYLFFICPSLISPSSRLRPCLGPERVRSLLVDCRNFRSRRATFAVPPSEWTRPDRRITTPIQPKISTVLVKCPCSSAVERIHAQLEALIRPHHKVESSFFGTVANQPETVEAVFWLASQTGYYKNLQRVAYVISLKTSAIVVDQLMTPRDSNWFDATLLIDLRNVVLLPPRSTAIRRVQGLVAAILNNQAVWAEYGDDRTVCVVFWIASDAMAKAVQDVLDLPEATDRKGRCRIDRRLRDTAV